MKEEDIHHKVVYSLSKVTRFEVIDHREIPGEHPGEIAVKGRVLVEYGVTVRTSFQDDGRTLKIFINERKEEDE